MSNDVKQERVYLASGFFNDEQIRNIEVVEKALFDQDEYSYFMPRLDNLGEEGKNPDWDAIYQKNVDELEECDYMIALTAGKDMGTLVEVGQFIHMKKPVIFFTPGLTGNFNLMLAKPAHRVCTTEEELIDALKDLSIKIPYEATIE